MSGLPMIDIHLQPEIAVACAAAVAAALALLWFSASALANRRLRKRSETLESSLGALRAELVLAQAGAQAEAQRALGRLDPLEQAYARMSERLRFVERRADGRSFDQAIDSARNGTESGKLAEQFGLSRGEAELVARMHGKLRQA
jgi:hypothetical protein